MFAFSMPRNLANTLREKWQLFYFHWSLPYCCHYHHCCCCCCCCSGGEHRYCLMSLPLLFRYVIITKDCQRSQTASESPKLSHKICLQQVWLKAYPWNVHSKFTPENIGSRFTRHILYPTALMCAYIAHIWLCMFKMPTCHMLDAMSAPQAYIQNPIV